MLAEAIHSVADSSNQALLFLGGRQARRAPTALHPFGYGRARYFWSFVVAVVLFLLGGLFSAYEGFSKIRDPHEITSPGVALGILGLAMVFEAFALRTAVKHARPELHGRSWWRYIRTSRSPELPVLLLEDSGALLGLTFAATGIVLTLVTGNPLFDGLGTLAIGVLLVGIAIVLALEMQSLLLGESADPEMVRTIESELAQGPGVRRVLHLVTQHIGPEDVLVAATLEFDPGLSAEDVARAIDESEARVRAAVSIARLIYLEPELAPQTALDGSSTGVDREGHGTVERPRGDRADVEDGPAAADESSAPADRAS
jgi:cation diffusion facilitator family transporter